MIDILDWIFEGMANWIASIMTQLMDAVSGMFISALGTDMSTMEEYFPFVTRAFVIMQYTAWALLFLITIWQLFRVFGGPITEAEDPWQLLARSALFAFLIGYAKPIFMITLDIARAPYMALLDASMNPGDFTFAGIEQTLSSGLLTITALASVVGVILLIVLMLCLGWNYFKLLLEVVERYIVVGVLCYTSPLAYAMGCSKATSKVFQSWCRMVGSQLLLLVMNVWFLRAFNSSVGQFTANGGALSGGGGNIFLWLFCALAFLKTAQKFDSYLSSLGLSVAQTGSSMGMEMLMAARMAAGFTGGKGSAGSLLGGATDGKTASATGTAGGFVSGFVSKFKGNSYVRDAVVDGGSKMGASGGIGLVGRALGGIAAKSGATLTGESISSVASRSPAVSGSIAGEIADRSLKNYMPHLASGAEMPSAESIPEIGRSWTDDARRTDGAPMLGGDMSVADRVTPPDMEAAPLGDTAMVESLSGSASYPDAATLPADASPTEGSMPAITALPDDGVKELDGMGATIGEASSAYSGGEIVLPDETVMSAGATIPAETTLPIEAALPAGTVIPADTTLPAETVMPTGSTLPAETALPTGVELETDGIGHYSSDPAITAATGVHIPLSEGAAYGSDQLSGLTFSNTQITGGHISTTATSADGKEAYVDMYNAAQYDKPDTPHTVVSASDGSRWYQVASGEGMGAFYSTPNFTGDASEASLVSETFPHAAEGTTLRTVSEGVMEANTPNVGNSMMYNSAFFQEPNAPHSTMHTADGQAWYAMRPNAEMPHFEAGEAAQPYNHALFKDFMPGYSADVSQINSTRVSDGVLEVQHSDGSGTAFYDVNRFQAPKGDYQVLEDKKGGQWYTISGTLAVERKPVYENGKPVYDGDSVKTINVETIKYKTTPTQFGTPEKRDVHDRKAPRKK